MKILNPCIITPRLLPGLQIGTGFVSIEYSPLPGDEGRTRYRYHIDLDGFEHSADDLQSGCSGGNLQSGLASLCSFLDACADSYPDGENANIFPPAVAEWASENSDEITLAGLEIEESDTPVIDE